jgi:HPr kinase/phosphorylase
MSGAAGATVHATAFTIGATGLIVTGASGAGKSLLAAGVAALWPYDPVRLVADDRMRLAAAGGRLVARPVDGFIGMVELRGIGMALLPAMPSTVIRGVVALEPADPPRMPEQDIETTELCGVPLPLLRLRRGDDAALRFLTKWPHFHAILTMA